MAPTFHQGAMYPFFLEKRGIPEKSTTPLQDNDLTTTTLKNASPLLAQWSLGGFPRENSDF